jgi:2'-5' RNA ligase
VRLRLDDGKSAFRYSVAVESVSEPPERIAELRTFVAIPFSQGLKSDLAQRLAAGPSILAENPVALERLHLTLQFLGTTLAEQLPGMGEALKTVADGSSPFSVSFRGVGAFPDERRPNTLWLGITAGVEPLTRLATGVGQALAPLGFEPSPRPFQPHVTLLRPKSPALGKKLLAALRSTLAGDVGSMAVDAQVLYRSETLPAGPRYTELSLARLRGGESAT